MLNGSTPSRSAPPPPVTPTPPPSQPSRQNSYSAAPQMTQSTTSNNYQTTSRDKTVSYLFKESYQKKVTQIFRKRILTLFFVSLCIN